MGGNLVKIDNMISVECNFQQLFSQHTAIQLIIDSISGDIINANISAAKYYGYSIDKLRKMNINEINISSNKIIAKEMYRIKTGEKDHFDFQHKKADGSIRDVEVYSSPIKIQDKIYLYSIVHDITARIKTRKKLVESELQYKKLVESMNDIVYSFSTTRGALYWSPKVEEILGFSVKDLMKNPMKWNKSIHPEDSPFVTETINNFIDGKSFAIEYRIMDTKGNWHWFFDQSIGRHVNDDEIIIEGTATDITKRKKLEIQLKKQNETLQVQVEKELEKIHFQEAIIYQQKRFSDMGQMINAIAHQWRQPLNNIYLIMQMIQDTHEGEDYGFGLDDLYKQHENIINFMSKTIDDFRNYFSVETTKKEFKLMTEIVNTASLLLAQMSANDIQLSINCKCKKYSFNYSSNNNAKVYCDEDCDIIYGQPGEFRQVILNILNNAQDAIMEKKDKCLDNGEINLDIEIDDDSFHIILANNGYSINEDVINKVFDPYFTTKEEGKGTGIGLYMSKMIIENKMKGAITVQNTNDGVEFHINLSKTSR